MEGEVKPEAQGEEAEALEATTSVPPSQDRPPSAVSRDSQGRPFQPEAGQTSPTSDVGEIEGRVPTAPHLPSPERTGTTLEGTMSNSALVSCWSTHSPPVLCVLSGSDFQLTPGLTVSTSLF